MKTAALRSVRHCWDTSEKRLQAFREKRCLATPLFYVEEQSMRLDYLVRSFAAAARVPLTAADPPSGPDGRKAGRSQSAEGAFPRLRHRLPGK